MTKQYTKLLHEGDYVAEVAVELICAEDGWSPYLSVEDAIRRHVAILDRVVAPQW